MLISIELIATAIFLNCDIFEDYDCDMNISRH
jgi:hypothetical protein